MKRFVVAAMVLLLAGAHLPVLADAAADWDALDEQVSKLYQQGNFARATELAMQSPQPVETTRGPNHPDVAHSLNNLASPPAEASTLEWALSDNGSDVNWSEATNYCASKGNGWRLPTRTELQSIFDPAQSTFCGPYGPCHVARKFHLSSTWFWTNEREGSSTVFGLSLKSGVRTGGWVEDRLYDRALCLRRS